MNRQVCPPHTSSPFPHRRPSRNFCSSKAMSSCGAVSSETPIKRRWSRFVICPCSMFLHIKHSMHLPLAEPHCPQALRGVGVPREGHPDASLPIGKLGLWQPLLAAQRDDSTRCAPGVAGANRILRAPGGQSKLQSRCFVLLSPVPDLNGSPVRASAARQSCDRLGGAFLEPQTATALHRGPPMGRQGLFVGAVWQRRGGPCSSPSRLLCEPQLGGRGWRCLTGRQCSEVGSASGVSRDAELFGTGGDAVSFLKPASMAVGSWRTRGGARGDGRAGRAPDSASP